MHRLAPVVVSSAITVLLLSTFAPVALAGEVHPYLQEVLDRTPDDSKVRVYAVFEDSLGLESLLERTSGASRLERRAVVTETLRQHADRTQARVRRALESEIADGGADRVRVIWMANVLAFEAKPRVVRELARYEEIASIHYDALQGDEVADAPAPHPGPAPTSPPPAIDTPLQPGLILINAEDAWALGVTGAGVVVANIDTGTDYTHPDLVNRMWINTPEDLNSDQRFTAADINGIDDDGNGLVDDVLGYDYGNDDPDPMDSYGHGTQTAGQVAGDGTNGLQTGVAPGARIMALKPWGDFGSSETTIWSSMQYAVDNGADVTTSSLSWKWTFDPQPNYPVWRQMTDMELAAGVVHTNSIGNQGGSGSYPIPYNVATPGNCPSAWLHPDQTLVGGISSVIGCGNVNAISDTIDSGSGRGPAAWEDIQATHPFYPYEMPVEYRDYPYETFPGLLGLLKPDVSAPGASTESTIIGGGYDTFGGTSSATPHTAGAAALVLSANPFLDPAGVSRVLQLSSIEKGAPGKDNEYGAGRIDAYRAVLAAQGNLAPTVTSLSASSLPMYQENVLQIIGDEFLGAVEVEFDGIPAASVVVTSSSSLVVTTPVFPIWDTVDVTVRTALGETTVTDALEFHGEFFMDGLFPQIGDNLPFHMQATANARWGYIVNTQLSSCVIKGLAFQVCRQGRLAISTSEMTDATGLGPATYSIPNDPGLVGETLYIQGGIDGNGTLPDRDWKVSNVISIVIFP